MPKVDQYIIQNEINKQYYKIDGSGVYYGKINEAWVFGDERLEIQTCMLERSPGLHEIILKMNKDGTRTKIR